MKEITKVNIKIIFPDKKTYEKKYYVESEDGYLKASRRYAHYILRKVYEKLYSNGFNEINFDVIKDIRKRINSPTSISNELLLNKSNSFRDFFISY